MESGIEWKMEIRQVKPVARTSAERSLLKAAVWVSLKVPKDDGEKRQIFR